MLHEIIIQYVVRRLVFARDEMIIAYERIE